MPAYFFAVRASRYGKQPCDAALFLPHVRQTMSAKLSCCRNIQVSIDGQRTAHVRLMRPDELDAVNAEMVAELSMAFEKLGKLVAVRVIVLRGEGAAFCADADLHWAQPRDPLPAHGQVCDSRCFSLLMQMVTRCPKPVLGLVHGMVYVAGLALCSACDFVLASHTTRFAASGAHFGIQSSLAQRCPAMSNPALMLTASGLMDGVYAEKVSLVHQLVKPQDMDRGLSMLLTERRPKPGRPRRACNDAHASGLERLPVGAKVLSH